MRIFNEDKTQEIHEFDNNIYYLKDDKLFIKHHDAVEEIKQISHLEIIRKNEKTGGVEYQEIIDVPYQPAKEEYDEYEDIQIIIPYTNDMLIEKEKQKIKIELDELTKDFIQVLCGAVIEDLEKKKQNFKTKHNRLRELENKPPRQYN